MDLSVWKLFCFKILPWQDLLIRSYMTNICAVARRNLKRLREQLCPSWKVKAQYDRTSLSGGETEWNFAWVTWFDWLFTGCYSHQKKKPPRRDFCSKLNVLLRIRATFGNTFMTQMSCHWHLSDNSDKWLEKPFNSMWLIDEPHSVTRVFHVLKQRLFRLQFSCIAICLGKFCKNLFCKIRMKDVQPVLGWWKIFSILVRVNNKCVFCVCVCVCVCVWEREREREGDREAIPLCIIKSV